MEEMEAHNPVGEEMEADNAVWRAREYLTSTSRGAWHVVVPVWITYLGEALARLRGNEARIHDRCSVSTRVLLKMDQPMVPRIFNGKVCIKDRKFFIAWRTPLMLSQGTVGATGLANNFKLSMHRWVCVLDTHCRPEWSALFSAPVQPRMVR